MPKLKEIKEVEEVINKPKKSKNMNIKECLDSLLDGNFIRRKDWGQNTFMYISNDEILFARGSNVIHWIPSQFELFSDDYEICNQYKE